MKHEDHVRLIQAGVHLIESTRTEKIDTPPVWADLGSGGGAFTLALAELLGDWGNILSVDKDNHALQLQKRLLKSRFPDVQVEYLHVDFMQPLPFRELDGILMANSLHFIQHKEPLLMRILGYLKPGGRFILVEYNVDHGNIWVPHPLSFETWQVLARKVGFTHTRLLHRRPSSFLGEFYSALSVR